MKLHADAKEFVPSAQPNSSKAAVISPASAPKTETVKPAKNGTMSGDDAAANAEKTAQSADSNKAAPKAAAPAKGAWGKKTSEAVKTAAPIKPQPQAQQKQHHKHGKGGSSDNKDGGWKRGEKGGKKNDGVSNSGSWARAAAKPGSGGNKGGGHHNRKSHHGDKGSHLHGERGGGDEHSWSRGKVVPVELLSPGEGSTDQQKAVTRISVEDLLAMRLQFLDAPESWKQEDSETIPAAVLWDSPTRVSEIEEAANAPRMTGDPTNKKRSGKGKGNPNDTAPPIEDCKPIEVNEETRWKAKVMEGADAEQKSEDSAEEVLRKALLILNKLSLTKFDKLSDEFINCGIARDIECLTGAVGLIVNKAQEEQHFSSMYAGLCLKLANTPLEGIDEGYKGKRFKKILLQRCQTEFETDTATKIQEATKDISDPEEIEYHSNLIKKHYLGHMRFIGELYKGDLISIKIMLFCLQALLENLDDGKNNNQDYEEKVECFAKLMTVIGSSLEQQSEAMKNMGKKDTAEKLAECWKSVEIMAGKRDGDGPNVSNRIKFMLQDLLEMKANGWVKRRKEETAKTIAQIHNEVAKEELAARRSSSSNALRGASNNASIRRGISSGDVRVSDRGQKAQTDEDGFVSVPANKAVGRSASMTAFARSQSDVGYQKSTTHGSSIARKNSHGMFAPLKEIRPRKSIAEKNGKDDNTKANPKSEKIKPKVEYPSPHDCGEKAKNILKEYFVGGDTDDAVLSMDELIGIGNEGHDERGSKVVETSVLMVLEMKKEEVDKFLTIFVRLAKEKKISSNSFVSGLNDPLEFLNDVAIDAPLAIPHLAGIVAELVKSEIIEFNFLLDAPEYFRTDQNAAGFGAQVLKMIGGSAITSEDYLDVVEKLMTDEDKAQHSSASELIAAESS
ncbi:hypothetical protein ACHAXS_012654 [Conticribra weissflogii]